jgi:SH3-like domain-containing protein
MITRSLRTACLTLAGACLLWTVPALAAAPAAPDSSGGVGKVSNLPVPRYASLKTDRVNLREGPSKDHRTAWVFQRAGLPVEITAEYETWRRIRDAEGTEGWVLHSLLSGRRTALVMPWAKAGNGPLPLYDSSDESGRLVAQLQPNVIASVKSCTGGWCRVTVAQPAGRDLAGFMKQDRLWGVYPNEKVE